MARENQQQVLFGGFRSIDTSLVTEIADPHALASCRVAEEGAGVEGKRTSKFSFGSERGKPFSSSQMKIPETRCFGAAGLASEVRTHWE